MLLVTASLAAVVRSRAGGSAAWLRPSGARAAVSLRRDTLTSLTAHEAHGMRQLSIADATPKDWREVVAALEPVVRQSRMERLRGVLARRRAGVHLVLENLTDPFNVAAVLRTAEGLGVQHIHTIEALTTSEARGAARGGKRAQRNVSMGAARWLTITRYRSSVECCAALRALDLRVLASDCPVSEDDHAEGERDRATNQVGRPSRPDGHVARPLSDLGLGVDGRGVALVFGHEARGVSRAFVEHADDAFYLPMAGLTQSFNISVSVAMALYGVVASGAYPEGTLDEDARASLLGRWLLRDVKAARQLLKKDARIEFCDF